jgi:hypothetical protein
MAAKECRLPRGCRKSGISAKTSINGRGCATMGSAPSEAFWLVWESASQVIPHVGAKRFIAPLTLSVNHAAEN